MLDIVYYGEGKESGVVPCYKEFHGDSRPNLGVGGGGSLGVGGATRE